MEVSLVVEASKIETSPPLRNDVHRRLVDAR